MRTTFQPITVLAMALFAVGCRDRSATAADEGEAAQVAASPAPTAAAGSSEACRRVEKGHGPEGEVSLQVETVVEGLEVPWAIAFLPDGDLLVTERPGRIRRVHDGELVRAPVATVEAAKSDEGGLMGLVLHPEFSSNRQFFVYYTARSDGGAVNRVERWRLAEDGRSAAYEARILDGIPAARWHDGGRIRIGPDGKLYVATGDATQPRLSQDRESLAGKLLRLNLDGTIPDDNPVDGQAMWLSGIRNLQAFDWVDDETLVLADHGPSGELGRRGHDEVSVARKGDNLGWPEIYACETAPDRVTPVLTWREAVPPAGGVWYTGEAIPGFRDSFVFSALRARHLHRVVLDPEDPRRMEAHEVYLDGEHGRLREVVQGPDGALWITTSNCDGRGRCPGSKDRILRITGG